MKSDRPRPYEMRDRLVAKEATARRIVGAMYERLLRDHYDDITLRAVADDAGVTVQTVLRHFSSKEALLEAVLTGASAGIGPYRDGADVATTAGIVDVVLTQYEHDGDALIRLLALGQRLDVAERAMERGRRSHQDWLERCLEEEFPLAGSARTVAVTAAVAATDVYTWQLCRRDRSLSIPQTTEVMEALLRGAIRTPATSERHRDEGNER